MPKGIYKHKSRSEETKKKISKKLIAIGHKPPVYKHTNKSKENLRRKLKNRFFSKETREKIRLSKLGKPRFDIRGKKCHLWKGGINPINDTIRKSIEFSLWRESVFTRDAWTCQKTGIKGGKLQAHHIQNFSQYPELRFAIDNGITLSKKAHQKFHKIYGFKNNNLEQLNEFLNK